jgi:hypothetical protein
VASGRGWRVWAGHGGCSHAFKAAYNLDANGIFDDVTATLLKQLIEDNDEAPGQKPEPEHKMTYLVTGCT